MLRYSALPTPTIIQPRASVSYCSANTEKSEEGVHVYGGKFKANRIIHVDDIPYYPECMSSKLNTGVLYVINMARMTPDQKKAMHTHIAYSHNEVGSSNETCVSYANAGIMRVRRFRCIGVKICSGLHADVVHHHGGGPAVVDILEKNAALSEHFADLKTIKNPETFQYGPWQARLTPEQMAFAIGQHIERRVLLGTFCQHVDRQRNVKCSGIPILQHESERYPLSEADLLYAPVRPTKWLLGCSGWKASGEETHFAMRNLEAKVDIASFRALLNQLVERAISTRVAGIDHQPKYSCSSVLHHSSRKVRCDEFHGSARCQYLSSSGKLGACSVTFNLLTPVVGQTADQETAYLFVHGGLHNHAPPRPDWLPQETLVHIKRTTHTIDSDVLRPSKTSTQKPQLPEFGNLSKEYNVSSVDTIHPAAKLGSIALSIERERLKAAPNGGSYNATMSQSGEDLSVPPEELQMQRTDSRDGVDPVDNVLSDLHALEALSATGLSTNCVQSNEYDRTLITNHSLSMESLRSPDTSGAVRRGRGRPKGSKNKITLAKIAARRGGDVLAPLSSGSTALTNGAGEICKARKVEQISQPQQPPQVFADPVVSVFDQVCLSSEDIAKLGQMPVKIQELFQNQCELLLAEMEVSESANSEPEVLNLRKRYPIQSFSSISGRVENGEQHVAIYLKTWQLTLDKRRDLLDQLRSVQQ